MFSTAESRILSCRPHHRPDAVWVEVVLQCWCGQEFQLAAPAGGAILSCPDCRLLHKLELRLDNASTAAAALVALAAPEQAVDVAVLRDPAGMELLEGQLRSSQAVAWQVIDAATFSGVVRWWPGRARTCPDCQGTGRGLALFTSADPCSSCRDGQQWLVPIVPPDVARLLI